MPHWAQQYLRKKWVIGARGPDAFDCWGLVVWCKAQHYGQTLPQYPGVDPKDVAAVAAIAANEQVKTDWVKLDIPEDGCVVAMGRNRYLNHAGIYLDVDGGRVLHAYDGGNVVADSLSRLKMFGMRRIEFYQWLPTY